MPFFVLFLFVLPFYARSPRAPVRLDTLVQVFSISFEYE